jgi:translation initiation factor eIF-2B subunit delta
MKDQEVTRVLLGASSLLSNGAMVGPAGTAMVAALAKARQIPVIVAAESYKFSEKVQLDSIVHNELGQASEIAYMAPTVTSDSSGNSTSGAPYLPAVQRQTGYRGAAVSESSGASGGEGSSSSGASGADTSGGCDPISIPARWRSSGGNNSSSNTPSSAAASLPFTVVNLRYDLTPIGNISVVATESGLAPPTSIPVLMREMQSDLLGAHSHSHSHNHTHIHAHSAVGVRHSALAAAATTTAAGSDGVGSGTNSAALANNAAATSVMSGSSI